MPTIQGTYLYFDSSTGTLKAILEAKTLTNKRTATASALASRYLSRKNASTLLLIGTGSLSPDLVRAHCSVRPIEQVWVYGRSVQKAHRMANMLIDEGFPAMAIEDLNGSIPKADIISCANNFRHPSVSR